MGHDLTDTKMVYVDLQNNVEIERLHVASQPTRLHILNLLTKNKKMYATQIGETLSIDRKNITFHLNALEKADLVSSKYSLSDAHRPVAVKYYQLTDTGEEILQRILQMI